MVQNKTKLTKILLIAIIVGSLLLITSCKTTYVCTSGDEVSNSNLCPTEDNINTQKINHDNTNKNAQQQSNTELLGSWGCQSSQGNGNLIFKSENQLILGGQAFAYKLQGDTLQISSNGNVDNYALRLNEDTLTLTYSDGFTMTCQKGVEIQQQYNNNQNGNYDSNTAETDYYAGQTGDYDGSDCWASAGCTDYDADTGEYTYEDDYDSGDTGGYDSYDTGGYDSYD